MKLFRCGHCGHALYFENVVCEHCGHRLGYVPELNRLLSLEAEGELWVSPTLAGKSFVFCRNAEYGACNWLVESNPGGDPYCRACRHNETVPALGDGQNLVRWQVIERAKKRLIYSLLQLRLPLATRNEDPARGLSFRFLSDAIAPAPVLTGHESGVVTIALAEADDAQREYRRTLLNEPYRTLLGHFRHEIGHYYWDLLVAGGPNHQGFRALFGDEGQDYDSCLRRHYAEGAPVDWQANFISAYASCHPWEDFAETWAHYLHLLDTVEMASAFGVTMNPGIDRGGELTAAIDFDPYDFSDIGQLIDNWVPLASLINNLNRAVGQNDAYPFVLTPAIIDKLGFIHGLVSARRAPWTAAEPLSIPAG